MMVRIVKTWRLWGYCVGSSGTWFDAWLVLNGCPFNQRISLRKAWRMSAPPATV
jgi:hypothetical protein